MSTTTTAVVTAVVVVVPKMLQVKCSVHNVMYILLLLYTRIAAVVLIVVVDAHNEIVGIIRTMICESTYKRSMFFCHACFASYNTWLAGSAVGLRTECTYFHNIREGCAYYCLVLLHTEVSEV